MQQLEQQLSQLKLSGFKDALHRQLEQPNLYQEQSFTERLALLFDDEIHQRRQRKIERLIRQARFRLQAELAHIDYSAKRQLNKAQIREISQLDWLDKHQNLILTGKTGCGKTYLACALGLQYCQQGKTVFYFRLKELFEKMFLASADGSYRKLLNKLINADFLILDDWGLEKMNAQQRSNLLELIDARYDLKSTLIASQLPIQHWFDVIGESTHADAILDRVVHLAIKIDMKGDSLRKKYKNLD